MGKSFKQDKGFGGLEILLSVIVMLFIIGFIVMIFAILGGKVEETVWTDITGREDNATTTLSTAGTYTALTANQYNTPICTILTVKNITDGATIASTNYTKDNCKITPTTGSAVVSEPVNVTYTYSAGRNNTASGVIFDTSGTIAGVTDWFGIIIVITAMVVLILLTVIIITTIRGSGMVSTGGSSGNTGFTA